MTAIARRSVRAQIPAAFSLADADDLDGFDTESLSDGWLDVTGCQRVVIVCVAGTLGTAGIDVVQISHDGGLTWAADDTLLLASANDNTGTIVADGALEAAGVDPVTAAAAIFKSGPYEGPTYMRVCRDTSDAQAGAAVDWITGAPSVTAIRIY